MSKQDVLTDGYATCGPTACVPEKDTSTSGSSEPGLGPSLSWHPSAVLRSLKSFCSLAKTLPGAVGLSSSNSYVFTEREAEAEWAPGLAGVFLLSPIAVGLGAQSPFPTPCFLRGPSAMAPISPVDSDCTGSFVQSGPKLPQALPSSGRLGGGSPRRGGFGRGPCECVWVQREPNPGGRGLREGGGDGGKARPAKAHATLPTFLLPQSQLHTRPCIQGQVWGLEKGPGGG